MKKEKAEPDIVELGLSCFEKHYDQRVNINPAVAELYVPKL